MLETYLIQVMSQSPTIALAVAGIVLCRRKLSRSHARASARATLGWALLILYVVIGRGLSTIATYYVIESGDRVGNSGWLSLASLFGYALLISSLLLLLLSTLSNRDGPESSNRAA